MMIEDVPEKIMHLAFYAIIYLKCLDPKSSDLYCSQPTCRNSTTTHKLSRSYETCAPLYFHDPENDIFFRIPSEISILGRFGYYLLQLSKH